MIITRCFAKKSRNPEPPREQLVKLVQRAKNHAESEHVAKLIDELFSLLIQNAQVNFAFLSPDFRKEYLDSYFEQELLNSSELSKQLPEALSDIAKLLQTTDSAPITPILGRIVAAGMKIQG